MHYRTYPAAVIILFGLGFSILVLSCTGTPSLAETATNNSAQNTNQVQKSKTQPNEKDGETNRPPVIEVSGTINFNEEPYRSLLRTVPKTGAPCFFTAVPRMANRDDEYKMGLMLLARQAAMNSKVAVTAKFLTQSNNRDMGYREHVDVDVDNSIVKSMVDKIEITTHYQDVEGSYFQGTFKGKSLPQFEVSTEIKQGVPLWFTEIPSFEGYITAVGTAQRHMFIAESFMQSDRQALAALAKQVNIEVKQKRHDMEVEHKGTAYQQLNLEISNAVVHGFYVIDRWVSEDGNTYYSLAVCPK